MCAEFCSPLKEGGTFLSIIPFLHDIFAWGDGTAHFNDASAERLGMLDHNDGIRSFGKVATRHDSSTLSGLEREVGRSVDGDFPDAVKPHRISLRSPEEIGSLHGIAIHSRAVGWRQGFRGHNRFSQYGAAGKLVQPFAFLGKGRNVE